VRVAAMHGTADQMRALRHAMPSSSPALHCRPVQRPRRLYRLIVRSMDSRPGFEPVEDGAKRSIGKESQAVYEYSTHQGLEMQEIDDDDAEVCASCKIPDARILPIHNYLCAGATQACLHTQVDFLGESTTGNLHLVGREQDHSIGNVLGLASVEDIVEMPVDGLRRATKVLYQDTMNAR
jgi:hypothetical protein